MFSQYHRYYEVYENGLASNCLYLTAVANIYLPYVMKIELDWDLGWIMNTFEFNYPAKRSNCHTIIEREGETYDISTFISARF